MEQKTLKIGIYVRVSTEEQAKEGISIKAQIDRCKAYCEARAWQVYRIYQDAGFSAGTMKRPAFTDLLQDAKEKRFDTVLVYKIDRFSRNLKDLILILEDLKKQEINFTSVTEQIDTTTAMGEAFFQIIGVFAQLERGMVKERVNMAFDKKISSGESLNRAPYGYMYKNARLIPDPNTAKNVSEIFAMWQAGINYQEICNKFGFSKSSLYELIKNPVYLGKIKFRGELFDGKHAPLVDLQQFLAVNPTFSFEESKPIDEKNA